MRIMTRTIRMQIVMAFLVCFVVMAGIIAVNYRSFQHLSRSMQLFELAGELNSTILEMRRYEKNYFLYRQLFNYEENVTYANKLALILRRENASLVEALGRENSIRFLKDVDNYSKLMAELQQTPCDSNRCSRLQATIRGTGQGLLLLADQFVAAERQAIDGLLRKMIPLPLVSLLVLVVLLSFVVFFIGERVIRPLARITRESEAVARGAFQRITPCGDTQNEVHHLVLAINRMMAEPERRHEQLVQSRKIASIGTLTAGIAHEVNNPINNIFWSRRKPWPNSWTFSSWTMNRSWASGSRRFSAKTVIAWKPTPSRRRPWIG